MGRWPLVLIKPHKKAFWNNEAIQGLFCMRTRAKLAWKMLLQVSWKKTLLTYYSHVLPALNKAKHISRIFITYFDNDKLKNEARELVKNLTTAFLTFWNSHLLIMWEITIFVLVQKSCLFKNFLFKKWRYFKSLFKSMQCFL